MKNELLERAAARKANQRSKSDKPLPLLSKRSLSKEEIADASDTVRANLIDAVLKISAKIASLPPNSIGPQNLAQVSKLTDTAAKLFSWPNAKPVDAGTLIQSVAPAINLALIRTTPDQLRAAAKQSKQAKQQTKQYSLTDRNEQKKDSLANE